MLVNIEVAWGQHKTNTWSTKGQRLVNKKSTIGQQKQMLGQQIINVGSMKLTLDKITRNARRATKYENLDGRFGKKG